MSHGKSSRSDSSKHPPHHQQGHGGSGNQELPSRPFSLPPGYYELYGISPPKPAPGAVQAKRPGLHQSPPAAAGILEYYGIVTPAAPGPVQQKGNGTAQGETERIHEAAARGTSGAAGSLPHLDPIQRSFGRHDVSRVQAHTGQVATEAAKAMGAEAYATGEHVAFAGAPSLHTAAHEAAHVIQQRAGVQLKGGVGEVGDPYERHADAVADAVVQGKSSEALLDSYAGTARSRDAQGGNGHELQRKGSDTTRSPGPVEEEGGHPRGADENAAQQSSSVYTVTDPQAVIRSAPPELKSTGKNLPEGSFVEIVEEQTVKGAAYANVRAHTDGKAGATLGWTKKSNLTPGQVKKRTAEQKTIDKIKAYDAHIKEASDKYGISVEQIRAIIATESRGDPEATSGAAWGLMQVTKGTWADTQNNKNFPELKDYDFDSYWSDPRVNILFGTATLKTKLGAIGVGAGDPNFAKLAITAYNAGEGTVNIAIKKAKEANEKDPNAAALDAKYLKPAIEATKIYSYYLTGKGKSRNKSGTQEEAIGLKFSEVSRYPGTVQKYLDAQKDDAPAIESQPAAESKAATESKTVAESKTATESETSAAKTAPVTTLAPSTTDTTAARLPEAGATPHEEPLETRTEQTAAVDTEVLGGNLQPVTPKQTVPKGARVTVSDVRIRNNIVYVRFEQVGVAAGTKALSGWARGADLGVTRGTAVGEVEAPRLAGLKKKVTDGQALLRGDDLKALSPQKVIPKGTEVTISAEKAANGQDYLSVTDAAGDYKGWTSKANLEGFEDGDYKKEDTAAWKKGTYLGQLDLLEVVGTDETVRVSKKTYPAFQGMAAAAAADGISITINSGFRTYGEQSDLYALYQAGKGNLAAAPGASNHQHGQAYDVATGMPRGNPSGVVTAWTATYNWLALNAYKHGFRRTVQSEAWHWEYLPGEASASDTNFNTSDRLRAYMAAHKDWKPYPGYKTAAEAKATAPDGGKSSQEKH